VISSTSVGIQAGIDEFRLDAGITYLDNEPLSHVRSLPLYREQYLLITPAGSALAGRTRVTWREAATLPLCLLTEDMQNRRIINAHFAEAGAEVHPALETNSVFTLCELVRSGYWSSVLPYGFLPMLSGAEGIAVVPLEGPAAAHTVGLVVPARDHLPPTVAILLDLVGRLDWGRAGGPDPR
jgi:DNA-binding transcriptional LysR family regulator